MCVKTYQLTQDEIWDNFGGHSLFQSYCGGEMVRVPHKEAYKVGGKLPDLVFSRRLPKELNGHYLDPTKMLPLPLAAARLALGKMPGFATEAYVLFGSLLAYHEICVCGEDAGTDKSDCDDPEEDLVFHVTAAEPTHALLKIERNAFVPSFFRRMYFKPNVKHYCMKGSRFRRRNWTQI